MVLIMNCRKAEQKYFKFATAININKCLKQINLPISHHTCASFTYHTSDILTLLLLLQYYPPATRPPLPHPFFPFMNPMQAPVAYPRQGEGGQKSEPQVQGSGHFGILTFTSILPRSLSSSLQNPMYGPVTHHGQREEGHEQEPQVPGSGHLYIFSCCCLQSVMSLDLIVYRYFHLVYFGFFI